MSREGKMNQKSNISNCTFLTKNDDETPVFYFPDPESGLAYINMDGYLLCPMEMFTPRQLKAAMKKYYRSRGHGQ
jgi:hypothetical protein